MRMWIDDLRDPKDFVQHPDTWTWAKSSAYAINLLEWSKMMGVTFQVVSFDHDLGGDDTTRSVVLWMCENDWWPDECRIHSANPVGREWLSGMINRYAPEGTLK
jgi:hypothetical protein